MRGSAIKLAKYTSDLVMGSLRVRKFSHYIQYFVLTDLDVSDIKRMQNRRLWAGTLTQPRYKRSRSKWSQLYLELYNVYIAVLQITLWWAQILEGLLSWSF